MFRNAKTGEISVGADNKVEQCTYIAAITRVEEELTNELTGGWKVIEVCSFIICAFRIVVQSIFQMGRRSARAYL